MYWAYLAMFRWQGAVEVVHELPWTSWQPMETTLWAAALQQAGQLVSLPLKRDAEGAATTRGMRCNKERHERTAGHIK